MVSDFRDKLQDIDLKDRDVQGDTARAIISTAEDTYKLLEELKRLNALNEENEERLRNDVGVEDNRKIIGTSVYNGVRFNVYEYQSSYVGDLRYTTGIYHAQKLGMKLRSLEIELMDGEVTIESGMFQSSEGPISLEQSFSPLHMLGGIVRKMNKETFFRPEFNGTGLIRLESNFKFVKLLKVERTSRFVLEKGIYLASAGDWKHKTAKNFNLGMMFFSDKSILQTELYGSGLIALELPVHPSELVRHRVTEGRPFKVSGDYVLYWAGNLKRKVNPAKKLLGNLASGRGLVEEYTGEGFVYTAPTLGFYNTLASGMDGMNTGTASTIGDGSDLGKKRKTLGEKLGFRGSRDQQSRDQRDNYEE